jgi:hypothetical protein
MKNVLLVIPLLAGGFLLAGCGASSPSASPAGRPAATPSGPSGPSGSPATAAAPPAASSGSPAARAAASGTPPARAASGGDAVPPCSAASLQVSLGGGPGVGMSQDRTGLQLRNTGSSACSLYGYPGVSWVAGADGRQVGRAAERQPDLAGGAEHAVVLAPGGLASAPLDIVDAAVIPRAECDPVPVRGLRVYPPGQRAALFLPRPTPGGGYGECSAATRQPTLIVGYVQPGAQPRDGAGTGSS